MPSHKVILSNRKRLNICFSLFQTTAFASIHWNCVYCLGHDNLMLESKWISWAIPRNIYFVHPIIACQWKRIFSTMKSQIDNSLNLIENQHQKEKKMLPLYSDFEWAVTTFKSTMRCVWREKNCLFLVSWKNCGCTWYFHIWCASSDVMTVIYSSQQQQSWKLRQYFTLKISLSHAKCS